MSKYRIVSLYSGSKGNSTLISTKTSSILIDAGKSAKALCTALGEVGSDIGSIDAIFITHEHSDHISALEALSKKHSIPIHITNTSASKLDRYPDSPVHQNIVRHDTIFCEEIGDIRISSFRTPHDSMMSVGYRINIQCDDGCHTVGFATDVGYASDSVIEGLCGCEAVVLEANHDLTMLRDGIYPQYLKDRIRSRKGHLSNVQSASLASHLASTGTRAFLLAHLSEENNEPQIAFDEINSVISDPQVCIRVASPYVPVELEV